MAIELWGTFSVRDHLAARAFVADVLLYDQLVIPTLPEGSSEDGWPAAWNLAKQRALLNDLGNLAIPIPWDEQRRATWQRRFDDANSEQRRSVRAEATNAIASDIATARDPQYRDLPYNITRILLQDYANAKADDALFKKLRVTRKVRPGSTLEAVSAYTCFDNFVADTRQVDVPKLEESGQPLIPTSVFGWQFFVPDSADVGEDEDRRVLAKAIKLASKNEFVEMRENFYQWWSDVAASGMSASEAKHDMEERILEYQKLMKSEGWKTTARYAIKIADAFSGGLGLVSEVASAGAEAFLGSADIFADERLKGEKAPARLKVAALFHDARTRLGWTTE
ncbi:MAG TPA: hypothetical protein VK828_02425 [Terriglobales bacterium]|jgi:hypothetical protein|nr:hypothetical protein [Terriglobales bacterium]